MVSKQPKRTDRPGVDRYGRTDLHYAAAEGDAVRVRELISQGSELDAIDDNGWTPLHFAAQAHSATTCEALLKAGAQPDPTDSDGNTPLFRAVFESRGRGDVIQLLRSYGATRIAPTRMGSLL